MASTPKGNAIGYYNKETPQLTVNVYSEFLLQYKLTDIPCQHEAARAKVNNSQKNRSVTDVTTRFIITHITQFLLS